MGTLPEMKLRAGAVALVVFAAGGAVADGGSRQTGRLLVTERVANTSGIYEEGAISYLRVRRVSDGEMVVRRRYRGRRIRLDEELPARRIYRLRSFVRPCSGSCRDLDPPTDRCSADFWLPPRSEVRARIVTNDGSRCRIQFWDPNVEPVG